ncbi:hypothetical protein [Polyangium sp. y55x31]|uniref:hypothetical protein n=1 Tax=Polyangium sp. y55x31 TaxID=3042688 RepID=UPI00248267A8|nr:hypothetical protein [Polyangium sp. y55x31]MDI1478342.1 hypothetical protein [Polyangium sp. y55x31]
MDVGLPDVGLPDVGLPDVGLPDVGLPDVGLPDVGFAEGAGFEAIAGAELGLSSVLRTSATAARSTRSMP